MNERNVRITVEPKNRWREELRHNKGVWVVVRSAELCEVDTREEAQAFADTLAQVDDPDPCYCCRQDCQHGCACYAHSESKVKDDEYEVRLRARMGALGMPADVGHFSHSNKYGFQDMTTGIRYPETAAQREALAGLDQPPAETPP